MIHLGCLDSRNTRTGVRDGARGGGESGRSTLRPRALPPPRRPRPRPRPRSLTARPRAERSLSEFSPSFCSSTISITLPLSSPSLTLLADSLSSESTRLISSAASCTAARSASSTSGSNGGSLDSLPESPDDSSEDDSDSEPRDTVGRRVPRGADADRRPRDAFRPRPRPLPRDVEERPPLVRAPFSPAAAASPLFLELLLVDRLSAIVARAIARTGWGREELKGQCGSNTVRQGQQILRPRTPHKQGATLAL